MWTAAIIAGGRATRLGGADKSALVVGGRRIIDRQLAVLRDLTGDLLIVTGHPERYAHAGVRTVPDRVPDCGALGGLYTALGEMSGDQLLAVGCDMPFLDGPFLRYLAETGRHADAAVPRTGTGYHPLCASYTRACLAPIRDRIEARRLKVTDALADVRIREVGPEDIARFGAEERLLFNINLPSDVERANELASISDETLAESKSRRC